MSNTLNETLYCKRFIYKPSQREEAMRKDASLGKSLITAALTGLGLMTVSAPIVQKSVADTITPNVCAPQLSRKGALRARALLQEKIESLTAIAVKNGDEMLSNYVAIVNSSEDYPRSARDRRDIRLGMSYISDVVAGFNDMEKAVDEAIFLVENIEGRDSSISQALNSYRKALATSRRNHQKVNHYLQQMIDIPDVAQSCVSSKALEVLASRMTEALTA